jgi:hypothetical protein
VLPLRSLTVLEHIGLCNPGDWESGVCKQLEQNMQFFAYLCADPFGLAGLGGVMWLKNNGRLFCGRREIAMNAGPVGACFDFHGDV